MLTSLVMSALFLPMFAQVSAHTFLANDLHLSHKLPALCNQSAHT